MRRGMPPPPRTGGPPVTNIRNTSSRHWRRWLKPENRCLVPANSFAENADAACERLCPAAAFGSKLPSTTCSRFRLSQPRSKRLHLCELRNERLSAFMQNSTTVSLTTFAYYLPRNMTLNNDRR